MPSGITPTEAPCKERPTMSGMRESAKAHTTDPATTMPRLMTRTFFLAEHVAEPAR